MAVADFIFLKYTFHTNVVVGNRNVLRNFEIWHMETHLDIYKVSCYWNVNSEYTAVSSKDNVLCITLQIATQQS